jgi:hypothetical protein
MARAGTFRHNTQCAVRCTTDTGTRVYCGVWCAMCYTAYPSCRDQLLRRDLLPISRVPGTWWWRTDLLPLSIRDARHDCCSNRPLNRPSESITLVRFTSVHDLLILDNDTTSPSRVALDMLTHSAHGDGASSSGPNPLEHPSDGASA